MSGSSAKPKEEHWSCEGCLVGFTYRRKWFTAWNWCKKFDPKTEQYEQARARLCGDCFRGHLVWRGEGRG